MKHENNFDLIRLAAAAEVVYFHSLSHLKIDTSTGLLHYLSVALAAFPGVPIFFFISGFLVTGSFERSRSLVRYAWNRALRIYPALWGAFAFSLLILGSTGFLTRNFLVGESGGRAFLPWILAQLTFFQFLGSSHFDAFGIGVVNGSLWTISVELGFYVLVPVVWLGAISRPRSRAIGSIILALLAALSFGSWLWIVPRATASGGIYSLAYVSPFPHLWLFLIGALAQRHSGTIMSLVRGKVLPWLGVHSILWLAFPNPQSGQSYGWYTPLQYLSLAGVTFAAAWTLPQLSGRILRGNDISYGVYLYHMLVLNLLIELGDTGRWQMLALTWSGTVALAIASWFLLEKPSLRLKAIDPAAWALDRLHSAVRPAAG
jgi:peptidoglycan/LPS O-acetylase OafA/YrhL